MPRRIAALDIWMNGFYVGTWDRAHASTDRFTYDGDWMQAAEGRPLSLSLPFTRGHGSTHGTALRSDAVRAYFENLIPDNDRILQRLRDRYQARSTSAFDLLAAIGRDCAGAVQLVPAGAQPGDVHRIDATPLDERGVAQLLRDLTADRPWNAEESNAFRISIAGAQEKTALLKHNGNWCIPNGATPSTHIFKLPLGLVGNIRADMRDSVELEWLCMEIVREFGLPVARTEIGVFEDQKALIVERFDRRLSSDGAWWIRIPQEDFCQALGLPPSLKYESDGGPGARKIMDVLRGSDDAVADRTVFFKAQLLFWLLAATDGHAKNFSIHLLPGGAYHLAPLYDILSMYPIQGHGLSELDPRKAKLAMAVEGRNRHYSIHEIHRWHWKSMAERVGLEDDASQLISTLVEQAPQVFERVGDRLPAGFPMRLYDAVKEGVLRAAQRLAAESDQRG